MKTIPFFTDDITIKVHSATNRKHIGKAISIKQFAKGAPVGLYELDNGDLRATKGGCPNIQFIDGSEVA